MKNTTWNNPKHLILAVMIVALAFFNASTVDARGLMTPEFRTAVTRPMSVVLLPPQAQLIKKKVVMTEQMVEESEALEKSVATHIKQGLTKKGYNVRALTVDEINADPELQELVRQTNRRYEEEWRKMVRKPSKVKERRYNAGHEARLLAAKLGADGIAFARVQAVGATGGQVAMALLLGVGTMGYARLDISVVNGITGDVEAYLYYTMQTSFKKLTTKPAKTMRKLTTKVLRKYPASGEVLEAKGTTLKEPAKEAKRDEAVLTELEALLGSEDSEETKEQTDNTQ